jgi:hypothetical protein
MKFSPQSSLMAMLELSAMNGKGRVNVNVAVKSILAVVDTGPLFTYGSLVSAPR